MITRASLLLALSLAVAAAPGRDVDVVVSAGTPLDWLNDLSRPTPTRVRTVPGAVTDRSTVAEEAPRIFSTDVYRFAKITTVDLIGEIPWTVRKDTPTPRNSSTATPGSGGAALAVPVVTDDVLWLGLAALLRRALHPALVSEPEVEEYLVHLGEAALLALSMAKSDPNLEKLCLAVTAKVSPAPGAPPAPPKGRNPLEAMLHRLVTEDLTAAYPFAFDGRFARRVALLGDEMYDFVIVATKSSHPFLRRNATLLLGRYPAVSAGERLRDLLEDADPVVQVRALDAVARRRDKASVPAILKLLRKGGSWPSKPSLVRALGLIGDAQAADAVRAQLKAHPGDYDLAAACVAALSRLVGNGDADYLALLDQLEKRGYSDPGSTYQAVVPDPPGTRTEVVRQLVLLARARAGHAASADKVLAKMETVGGRRAFSSRAMGSGLLATWHAPVVYPLLETLRIIPKGDAPLFRIVEDMSEDLSIRVRALAELARLNPPGLAARLRRLVSPSEEFAVASVALHALSILGAKEAVEAARELVDSCSPSMSASRKALVAEAVGILASRNAADPAALARMVEFEIIAHERKPARPPPAPKPDPNPMGQGPSIEFEAPVTFLEDVIVALGRCQTPATRAVLRDALSLSGLAGRAEAAVALAAAREPRDGPALLGALADKDPWVRFMAHRSLKFILTQEAPCDWMYGSAASREAAAAKYAQWVKAALE
jgi:HEAT repeat protein